MSTTVSSSYNSPCIGTHHYGLQPAIHFPVVVAAHHDSSPHSSPHSSTVISGGQTHIYTYSKAPGDASSITLYPSSEADQKDVRHTYASYSEEPVSKITFNSWTTCVEISIPTDIVNPTLTSFVYVIKYASTHDQGNSTIQADTILTQKSIPVGVVTESNNLGLYRPRSGYGPRTVDKSVGLCLSSAHAIKGNGGGPQWSHYIDQQHITPNVRVLDKSHIYLAFHVHEYSTAQTTRSLAIDVSATWQEDVEGRKAKEEAERVAEAERQRTIKAEADRKAAEAALKAKEEADRKAAAEAARKAKEEADRKAKEEADKKAAEAARKAKEEADRKAKEEADKKAAEAARKAKEEADRKAKEEADKKATEAALKAKEEADKKAKEEADRKAKEEADRKAREEAEKAKPSSVAHAPPVADKQMQDHISETVKKLGLEPCPNGYGYQKKDWGYQCSGGGHRITFEQLGMK